MAIDGSGIIASDDAHDIQQAVREAWRAGQTEAQIAQALLAQAADFCSDALHTEIYWAALAQSLWDIGAWPLLPPAACEQALTHITGGPCADWQQLAPGAFAQRRHALAALATRLSQANPKPLKRGKPTPAAAAHLPALFTPGALLAVRLSEAVEPPRWGACVLLRSEGTQAHTSTLMPENSPASEVLALLNLQQAHCPSFDEIGDADIAYRTGWGFLATCELRRATLAQAMPRIQHVGQIELSDDSGPVAWRPNSVAEWLACWQREAVGQVQSPMWDLMARIVWDGSAPAP